MSPSKAVEGFADWEPAHAVAELRRHGQYRVESAGLTSATVESMGGLRVLPSTIVNEVDPADVAALILPGGDRWENSPVEPELEVRDGQLVGDDGVVHFAVPAHHWWDNIAFT